MIHGQACLRGSISGAEAASLPGEKEAKTKGENENDSKRSNPYKNKSARKKQSLAMLPKGTPKKFAEVCPRTIKVTSRDAFPDRLILHKQQLPAQRKFRGASRRQSGLQAFQYRFAQSWRRDFRRE